MVGLLRHRQTKGPVSARPHLNRRATPRLHPKKVSRWRRRFLALGVPGLQKDAHRPGRKPTIGARLTKRVVTMTTRQQPANATHWSTRTMAAAVGISEASVRRIWRAHGLKPHRVQTFKISNDPAFAAAVDATGRSAAWSRPVVRQGRDVATLFEAARAPRTPARITRLAHGWAFSIGVDLAATIGLVGGYSDLMDGVTRASLGVEGDIRFIGRRPAFPQWCQSPIRERRISVGDAALAYNPVAGHGRSEEHTSELQSLRHLVCRLLLE